MRYRIVDVFSHRPLAGNYLCVVLDECPEDLMHPIARETNLSETTFPTIEGPGSYRMRIFTPAGEIPFAGHPSLGTAWALGPGTWTQRTKGATVTVEVHEGGAEMSQPDPALTEIDPEGMAAALGLAGVEGAWLCDLAGTKHVLVPTDGPLDAVDPDQWAIADLSRRAGSLSLCPFRRIDDATLQVRLFAPVAGIVEDPGTGSAAGPVGLLARRLWGTDSRITIRQGDQMGRPCRIEVQAVEGDVRVGGPVAAAAEGRWLV